MAGTTPDMHSARLPSQQQLRTCDNRSVFSTSACILAKNCSVNIIIIIIIHVGLLIRKSFFHFFRPALSQRLSWPEWLVTYRQWRSQVARQQKQSSATPPRKGASRDGVHWAQNKTPCNGITNAWKSCQPKQQKFVAVGYFWLIRQTLS